MDVYKDPQSHQTRRTLIDRLVNRVDSDWHQFFDTYWRLIYSTAYAAGLSPSDCEEVVQETVMAVLKQIDTFKYDPEKGRFRSWLLSITRNKVKDQFRRIAQLKKISEMEENAELDPGHEWEPGVEQGWGEEWQKNLLYAAMDNLKKKLDPKHFQIFYMINIEESSASEVSEFLGISRMRIYLINHRVKKQITGEVQRLGKEIF